ncbi:MULTISPECIES: histidine phosphatase family protein [Bifidobacterium]|uniref:histidine phosphatase family protein n=1 Tax=Bifidobacterium TaxID=1678 RepID=UPI001BDD0F06|nr:MULTISPECIES: histidine phosphatase family protein [Bifidobacterium]MBT1160881.1 histidine phosphatase family protein [Bifidobacterium sp. SO1]MBW3077656.1 histidine phosphatase family protein [Bifidobacterium simiiventris]
MSATEHVRSITLVRHGRTSYNVRHCFQGQIDIPLDEVGRWQVEQTGAALKSLYVDGQPDGRRQLVVASDLSRAAATAHAFADPLGLDVHLDERVRERNFGQWEGMEVAEIARQYPDAYRSWAEFRGGELEYGCEPKEHVGARGVAALDDWAHRAGDDTDLFVFSHGSCIMQTTIMLLGLDRVHPEFTDVVSMRNAHWARFVPVDMPDGTLRWRLMDYNHGPAAADTDQWEHPPIED